MRLDLNSKTEMAASPRLVAVYRPWSEHTFRLGYGLAFRKPSFFENQLHVQIVDFNQAMPEIVAMAETQFGNESLKNEKVHSFELGWRGRFLDDRLRASLNLYYNIYQDPISFMVDLPNRLGAPDIRTSTFRFENEGDDVQAFGAESELVWHPHPAWTFWGTAALRRVANRVTGVRLPTVPQLRIGLAGRYLPENGWIVDLSLHYVSTYKMPLIDPSNILNDPELMQLGDNVLVFSRMGYRIVLGERQSLEVGLTARTPIGLPFREYAGIPFSSQQAGLTSSDFGGEMLTRLVSLYLRGSF